MASHMVIFNFGLTLMFGIYFLCPFVSYAIFLEAGPQNTTVVEGDRVSMICDLNDDNDKTIFWTYLLGPSRRRYVSSNGYIYPSAGYGVDPENYEVIIDESQQTYELVIKSINLSKESGTYECGYDYGANRKYTPLATTTISVRPFTESVSCHQYLLPSLGSEISQEYEVACSWTHSQAGVAHFDNNDGDSINVDLRVPGRIISRIQSQDTPGVICRFMLESDTSLTLNAPCIGDNTPGLVRVDPYVSEVALGSNSSFICTSGNQNYSPEISWDVSVNGSEHQERLVESGEVMSIVNVQAEDEKILVECQVRISQDVVVSSFASLRIVEITTPPTPRPPGESQSNRTTDKTTMPNDVIEVTRPVTPRTGGNMGIAVTVVIIFVIVLIALIIVIIILVRRRNRGSVQRKYGQEKQHTYDAIEMQKIPHTKHEGSSQLYAVSFKDKKTKRHRSFVMDQEYGHDADESNLKGSFSSSSWNVLNLQPESTEDQIYAEADGTTENQLQKNPVRLCNSMPLLDSSEYETISEGQNARSTQMAKTLSSLSVSSSTRGDRRWTSQRLKKDAPWTPPMSRHATSFRKPGVKTEGSNSDNDYTKMTIKNKASNTSDVTKSPGKVPLYAKPDKSKKKSRRFENSSPDKNANDPKNNIGSDYADIESVGSRSQNGDDLIDTYLSNIPDSFNSSLPTNMRYNKATSLNRSMSSRPAPPKPQRGKCQSMGIPTYQTISDYEIMSSQVNKINEDDVDYEDCSQSERQHQMGNYDQPRNSIQVRAAHTLPRLNEGAVEAMGKQGYWREGRRVKSLDNAEYELIGSEGGFCQGSVDVPPSPQYADIGETMNAYSSVLDGDANTSECRQETDNDYSDID